MHNYAGQASFGLRYHIVQKVTTVYLHNSTCSINCAHEQEVKVLNTVSVIIMRALSILNHDCVIIMLLQYSDRVVP